MNENRREVRREKRLAIVLLFLAVIALLLFSAWSGPCVATWALTGAWPRVTFGHAWLAAGKALLQFRNADSDWPARMRLAASARGRWWLPIIVFVATEIVLCTAAIRQLDRVASRPVADRRWWQLRGIAPRTFGRTHTVAPLLVGRPLPDRITIGTFQGRKLAVQKNVHVVVIAPSQSGKSSGIIIPALLEHKGPAISTTVRTDVRDKTIARRRQIGHCYQYNPMDPEGRTDFYDPLHGCRNWDHALRVASWFIGAVGLSGSGSQDYFNEEAETLLAPYIYAAAWHPRGSIVQVFDWLEAKDQAGPASLLQQLAEAYADKPDIQEGARAALRKLDGMFAYNDRQLDGILGTARVFMKVYGRPRARKAASPYADRNRLITPQSLFGIAGHGKPQSNTLYIVADRDDQRQLAPIIVMMLSEIVYYLDTLFNQGYQLPVSCMFSLDETAGIAPIERLPNILSASLPNSRFITVWHSISQMQERYGQEAAREILGNSLAKVYLGSNTDSETVTELERLIGQPTGDTVFNPNIITAQSLQRLTNHEGILVHTSYPPTLFRQRRYYEDRYLRQLAYPEPEFEPPALIPQTTGAAQ